MKKIHYISFLIMLLACYSIPCTLFAQAKTATAEATPKITPTPKAWESIIREDPAYQQKYDQLLKTTGKKTPTPPVSLGTVTAADTTPRPTPLPILSLRLPPEQVVVAEVGDQYLLTLKELQEMIPAGIGAQLVEKSKTDPDLDFLKAEAGRQKIAAMDEALRNWLVAKTLATIAVQKGTTITDAEVKTKYQELESAQGGAPANSAVALGISQEMVMRELRDALIVDKYIREIVKKRFSDQDLAQLYAKSPGMFKQPAQIHVWHIYKEIPPDFTDREVRDLREEFYTTRKKAAKNDGKDFEKIAAEVNPMVGKKHSNGDMGWVDERASTLAPELMKAILKMKPGEVSPVIRVEGKSPNMMSGAGTGIGGKKSGDSSLQVRTGGSLHVLKVVERQPAKGETFDDFARQRVIDSLIDSYRTVMGPQEVKNAPFKVLFDKNGIRPVGEANKK